MLWHIITLVFGWLSTYRWNNFPRIERVSATDHFAFLLHVSLLLASVIEEEKWIVFDRDYIFRKTIFSSFFTLSHSDISAEVKNHIRLKDPKIYQKLNDVVYDMLLSWKLPEWMKRDISVIAELTKSPGDNEFQMEDDLLDFSRHWVSYYEAHFSNAVYLDVYGPAMRVIAEKIEEPRFDLFRSYIDLDVMDQNDLEKYLINIRRLQSSFRWNKMRRHYPISVMSHLFIAVFMSYIIGNLEGKTRSEITRMMTIALFHDIPEAITGDIITPTKKSVAGLEDVIASIEGDLVDRHLLWYISKYEFSKEYRKYMLDPWGCENGKLVKLADVFSALFEAKIEAPGSVEFDRVYKNIKKGLHGSPYMSVDHLFKFWIDYFDDAREDFMKFEQP